MDIRVQYDISLQMRMIKAIQEQQSIIDYQQLRIDELTEEVNQIDMLRAELAELKTLIRKDAQR